MPSEKYLEQEKKAAEAKAASQAQEAAKQDAQSLADVSIYWHNCKKGQIDNFKEEERYHDGKIRRPARAIEFFDHIHTTSDPDVVKFIESSASFGAGVIVKCANMEEANRRTSSQTAMKNGVRTQVASVDQIDRVESMNG